MADVAVTTLPLRGTFTDDPTHSSLRFSVTHMNVATFSASFDDVELRLLSDEEEIRVERAVGSSRCRDQGAARVP